MGAYGMETGTKHTTLRNTTLEDKGGGNVMINPKQLRSADQEVEKPAADGGPKAKFQINRGKLIWCYG